jgi:hypothetical protein
MTKISSKKHVFEIIFNIYIHSIHIKKESVSTHVVADSCPLSIKLLKLIKLFSYNFF